MCNLQNDYIQVIFHNEVLDVSGTILKENRDVHEKQSLLDALVLTNK
jgi:hypothetical protein